MERLKKLMLYPSGLLINYDGWVYKVQGASLLPLVSWSAAMSWNQPILAADEDLVEDNYDISKQKLGYRPTTVVRSTDGTKYYIDGINKRKMDKFAFRLLGFNDFETVEIDDQDLKFHPTGADLIG